MFMDVLLDAGCTVLTVQIECMKEPVKNIRCICACTSTGRYGDCPSFILHIHSVFCFASRNTQLTASDAADGAKYKVPVLSLRKSEVRIFGSGIGLFICYLNRIPITCFHNDRCNPSVSLTFSPLFIRTVLS